jgi:integrase
MPRTAHVPTYRLHKPSGQARVIVRGKQIYLGAYGSPESREKYARIIAELPVSPAVPVADAVPTLGQLLIVQLAAGYLTYAEGYYQKDGKPTRSIERVRTALKVLRGLYAHLPAADFGPLKLQAIQRHLIQEGKSRRYVNHLTQAIRRVFKWGVSQEMVPASVLQALAAVPGVKKGRTQAKEPERVKPVPDAVVQATLPHLPQVVCDMVRFQRRTGCRPGEVCILRPSDLDRSGPVWVYRPHSHKTDYRDDRDRVILIGPKTQDVLRPYVARLVRADEHLCGRGSSACGAHRRLLGGARERRLYADGK